MQKLSFDHLDNSSKYILAVLIIFASILGLSNFIQLWYVYGGTTPLPSDYEIRSPYWDFSNLWGGSSMAISGHVDWLFKPELYRAELNRIFDLNLTPQEWSYPPHTLLFGGALATVPIFWAYTFWSLSTLLMLVFCLKNFRLPVIAVVFVALSPAIWSSLLFGQYGAFTAALLIGGLYLAPKKPILAGILFGLLTMKPHLGMLVPFCLFASFNWRAIFSAGITTIILVLASVLLFDYTIWVKFFEVTRPLMVEILEAPYGQGYQAKMLTGFVFIRSLDEDLSLAYLFQGFLALSAIATSIWLWRDNSKYEHETRVIATAVLAIIATPYAYIHDSAPYYLALAWYVLKTQKPNISLIAILWIAPTMLPLILRLGSPAIGVFLSIIVVGLLLKQPKPLTS